ncbi:hypothetical protein AHiyo6_36100, partial [Arthrobacter sp. Hiyo6]
MPCDGVGRSGSLHILSFALGLADHGDIRGVSLEGLLKRGGVRADQDHGLQPLGVLLHQLVVADPLREPSGDPDNVVERGKGRRGGMRVGRFGIVDPEHIVVSGHQLNAVFPWQVVLQSLPNRRGRYAISADQAAA